jgi:hypothetical protein
VTSDLVILARMSGMPYEELIAGILQAAMKRYDI